MNWFYSGSSMKSIDELDSLVNDVILSPDFDKSHLNNFSTARELKRRDPHAAQQVLVAERADHGGGVLCGVSPLAPRLLTSRMNRPRAPVA
jgi:hypothetical protein